MLTSMRCYARSSIRGKGLMLHFSPKQAQKDDGGRVSGSRGTRGQPSADREGSGWAGVKRSLILLSHLALETFSNSKD